jgi:hypothetical protein
MTVDAELDEFEDNLRHVLDYHLVVSPDWAYWEEVDAPNREFFQGLDAAIVHVHQHLIDKYNGTTVVPIVQNLCEILRVTARASMNVPFPRYPELHAHAVSNNLIDVYTEIAYAPLRTEMIMINHFASYIQRNWKRVNTDPSHPVCRNRLLREFSDLEQSVF